MAVGCGPACAFCAVVDGTTSAEVVAADAATLTILDVGSAPATPDLTALTELAARLREPG